MAEIINLQLFAEGAAAGNAGTPATSTASNPPGNESGGDNAERSFDYAQDDQSGALKDGSASKNSSDAGNNKLTDEQRQAAYDAFISENKDLHQAHIQNIFNKRFKDEKQKDETIASQNEILGIISQKYGIKDGDIDALRRAVEGDNSYLEEAAEREGLSVEQYREVSRLRADAERTRKLEEARRQQSEMQRSLEGWFREAAELKEQTYPDFDFKTEWEGNVSFRRLLQAGIPVKLAYETIHMNDIVSAAREDAKKSVVDTIRERQDRPPENGLKGSGGFVLGKDVSKLTKKERRELNERARRGETIVL